MFQTLKGHQSNLIPSNSIPYLTLKKNSQKKPEQQHIKIDGNLIIKNVTATIFNTKDDSVKDTFNVGGATIISNNKGLTFNPENTGDIFLHLANLNYYTANGLFIDSINTESSQYFVNISESSLTTDSTENHNIEISNISCNNAQTAYLLQATQSTISAFDIIIDKINFENIEGDTRVFSGDGSVINASSINISNINSKNTKQIIGASFLGSNINAKNIDVNGITADKGLACGLMILGSTWSESLHDINISNISSDNAYGMFIGAQSSEINNSLKVETINGKNSAIGLKLLRDTVLSVPSLTISNVTSPNGIAIGLQADHSKVNQIETVGITMNTDPATYISHESNKKQIKSFAINANASGAIDWSEGKYEIGGNLLADNLSNDPNSNAGSIKISGNARLFGDVYAVDGGTVDLSLKGKDAVLVGQTDAWLELSGNDKVEVAHTSSLHYLNERTSAIEELKATSAGTINLALTEQSAWWALGQSSMSLLDNNGTVDMTTSPGASVYTQTLKGSGAFNMMLDPTGKNSNMLYVANALTPTSQNTINVKLSDTVRANSSLEDLVGIRFATTGGSNDSYTGNEFKAQMLDQGFNNVTLTVGKEAYDKTQTALNEKYNGVGTGEGDYKPGNNYVDHIFGQEGKEGTNWYISGQTVTEPVEPDQPTNPDTKPEKPNNPPESTLSDAGLTILATARSNYWTAVEMDRLNKRLGDARYAKGDDGVWLRMRYESNGTNSGQGDFESDAVTYQAGFDHAFKHNNGRWIVGGAVDYKDAEVDYKSVSAEGNTDRLGLKVYGTWLGDNGAYVDLNAIWGALSNKFDIVNGSGQKITADYDNNIMGLSAETGHRFMMGKGFFAEPQMQLQYLRVTDANYTTSQGTRMVHDDFDSVISRVGLRGGMEFGEAHAHTVYAKADWMHEWSGDQKITAYDVTTSRSGFDASIDNKGSWYDVGFGAQAKFSEASYGFLDMEYRFGHSLDKSWVVNAGVRYAF